MKKLFFLLLLIFCLVPCRTTAAAGKVVIVSLACVDPEQLLADKNMAGWTRQSSVCLLNTGTAGSTVARNIYATIGAGSRALGTEGSSLAYKRQELYNGSTAAVVFQRHQGKLPQGEILHLGMAQVIAANQTLQHPVRPGLLGDLLRENGKKKALIGNADGRQANREAALIIAGSRGEIDYGDVTWEVLLRDEMFPYGVRLDKERVWEVIREVFPQTDVLLVDWGDTLRLNEYRSYLREDVAREIEREIFADLFWLLQQIESLLNAEDLLLLLAAVPPAGAKGEDTLGFAALSGGSFTAGTLLTSATTKRPGLAAVTDIAPLILAQTGIEQPAEMIGRRLVQAGEGGIAELLQMRKSIGRIWRLRPVLLKAYVFFQIIIVLAALLNFSLLLFPHRLFIPLLFGLLVIPLLLLYLPLNRLPQAAGFVLTLAAAAAMTYLLLKILPETPQRLAAIAFATAFSLTGDILCDARLMKISVFGYDPVAGARYYGLGNEYMGILVGCAVLAAAASLTLWPRLRRRLLVAAAIIFVFLILLIISPRGGANFGGSLTATVAFVVTMTALTGFKLNRKSICLLLAVLIALALAAVLMNSLIPGDEQSHLGRTLVLLKEEGLQVLWDIIARKAAMNVRLMRYSHWSRAFLAFLAVLAVLFFRPRGILKDLRKKNPALFFGFLGIIAGSITALLVNDSGVVAAATTLLYAGVPIVILVAGMLDAGSETGREKL